MSNVQKHDDDAVVATFDNADSTTILSMGSLAGNTAAVQLVSATGILNGSNDGVGFSAIATSAEANDIVVVAAMPRFLRSNGDGAIVAVGWRAQ